jgi:hypothetical protein
MKVNVYIYVPAYPPGTHCMNWIADSKEPRAVRPKFVASLVPDLVDLYSIN